jgi:hypothetical protein
VQTPCGKGGYGGGNHWEGGGGCGIQGVDMTWAIRQNRFFNLLFKALMGHGRSLGLASMGMGIHAYGRHARAWACGSMGVWGWVHLGQLYICMGATG